MVDKIIKNNQAPKSAEESKTWLGKDGIVRMKPGKTITLEAVEKIVRDYREIAKKLPAKPKVLIDMELVPHTPASMYRKKLVSLIKDVFKDPGFGKVALWERRTLQRITTSFVFAATRLGNFKFFKTEKEALKWLKK